MAFETVKKKDERSAVVNKDCPYGYPFCLEIRQSRDKRYIQELTCNWIQARKGITTGHLSCAEMKN